MEPTEVKALTEKIGREWTEFKAVLQGKFDEEVKRYGAPLGDTNAKLDKIGSRLDAFEIKLQRPALETAARIQSDVPDEMASTPEQRKSYFRMLRKGYEGLGAEDQKHVNEVKTLVVTDDTTGGFGAPAEFSSEIIKGVVSISPMRGLVSVRNTGSRSIKVMKRTGTFAAQWVGGGGTKTRTETTGLTYGLEEIPTHEIYAMVDIAQQDLEDVQFSLEQELSSEFTDQFALAEGVAVISGSGNGQPEGILTNGGLSEDVTGDANFITYDGLVDVSHNIKEQYLPNARFAFNLKTLGAIRKIKDGNGDPIWAPLAPGAPATILGLPYTVVVGMPNATAGLYPVVFGDFAKAYRLADRVSLVIERDPYTQKAVGAVRFWARKRLGGQIVLAEALRKLKVSA